MLHFAFLFQVAPPSLGKEIEACDVTAGISAIKPGGIMLQRWRTFQLWMVNGQMYGDDVRRLPGISICITFDL